jgi:hypothetical protein
MANIEEMKQEAADKKAAAKAEKAYMGSLTSTQPAPAPTPAPAPASKTVKKAKGGVTRADGCVTKGHTRGKMI